MSEAIGVPQTYLTSTKNLGAILEAITRARAPKKFTIQFLLELGFKSTSDRLVVNLLKALDFLNDVGEPQDNYFKYLDSTQSKLILAQAISNSYEALFRVRRDAHNLTYEEAKEKLKVITQGAHSNDVVGKMAKTFTELCKLAEFQPSKVPVVDDAVIPETTPLAEGEEETAKDQQQVAELLGAKTKPVSDRKPIRIDGLMYNINIVLPETRDTKVYDAIFSSLKDHLLYE